MQTDQHFKIDPVTDIMLAGTIRRHGGAVSRPNPLGSRRILDGLGKRPVALDLRTLTALFKLVTDLERIGDEAVDIARGSAPTPADAEPIRVRLRKMAELSKTVFDVAVSSFLDGDVQAAGEVRRMNGAIDALYGEVLDDSIAFATGHPTQASSAVASMNVAKCLHRIAQYAKNIAEGTLFVVRGEDLPR